MANLSVQAVHASLVTATITIILPTLEPAIQLLETVTSVRTILTAEDASGVRLGKYIIPISCAVPTLLVF